MSIKEIYIVAVLTDFINGYITGQVPHIMLLLTNFNGFAAPRNEPSDTLHLSPAPLSGPYLTPMSNA